MLFETKSVIGEVAGRVSPISPWRGTGYTEDGQVVVASGFGDASYVTSAEDGSAARLVQGGPNDWFPDMNAPGTFVSFADPTGRWVLASAAPGDVVYEAPEGWTLLGASWDGSRAAIRPEYDPDTDRCGPTRIVATADRDVVAELSVVDCPAHPYFSPDGTLLYLANFSEVAGILDTETGEMIVDLTGSPYPGVGASFNPDGTMLFMGTEPVYVLDVAALVWEQNRATPWSSRSRRTASRGCGCLRTEPLLRPRIVTSRSGCGISPRES